MATTNFSGPVGSPGGFKFTPVAEADLPAAADNLGLVMMINDGGAGNDETLLVVSNGTAWQTVDVSAI